MFDVITLGSATKDIFLNAAKLETEKGILLELGKKIELDQVWQFSGGGGVNTAMTFAQQGLKTAFAGVLGQDLAGQEILDELNQKGVDVSLVKIKAKVTTDLGLIFHAESERTILLFHSASRTLSEKDLDWEKLKETNWLYLTPLWGEATRLTEKLVDFAQERRIKISINPSFDQLRLKNSRQILSQADVLLLNDDEASFLTKVKPYQKTKVLQQLCAERDSAQKKIIVITKGKEGATASDGKFLYQVEAPEVEVVDATGAGDSFGAGLVSGLIRGKGTEKSLKLAMANAISNIQVFGANQGLLDKNDELPEIKMTKKMFEIKF